MTCYDRFWHNSQPSKTHRFRFAPVLGQLKIKYSLLVLIILCLSCSTEDFFIIKDNEAVSFLKKTNEILRISNTDIGYNSITLLNVESKEEFLVKYGNKELFVVNNWCDSGLTICYYISSDSENMFLNWFDKDDNKPGFLGSYSIVYKYKFHQSSGLINKIFADDVILDEDNLVFSFIHKNDTVANVKIDNIIFRQNGIICRNINEGSFDFIEIQDSDMFLYNKVLNCIKKTPINYHSTPN